MYPCLHINFRGCFALYFDRISCKTGKKDNSSRYAYNISISVNGMGSTYDNPFIYKVATFDYINTMRLEIIIYNKHFGNFSS